MVTVTVVLAKNLVPEFSAAQYLVSVSEGVPVGSEVVTMQVGH